MAKQEIFFSIDIETDGPIPGPHSILSFAVVAIDLQKGIFDSFEVNLKELEGAKMHPETAKFWADFPSQYAATRTNTILPSEAMFSFNRWVKSVMLKFPNFNPVLIAYPAGFDFTFIYWYMMNFTGVSPFRFTCLDIKTYACVMLKKPYSSIRKSIFPDRWKNDKNKHTHIALDDAIEQGEMFLKMYKENLSEK